MKRLEYLDGWRGMAVSLLLIGHFLNMPGLSYGTFGVELFFVLSGRLMAEILFVEQLPLQEFFRRRISRVWPATIVFVITMLLLFGSGLLPTQNPVKVKDAVLATTFTLNYALVDGYRAETLGHIWSLCIEEHTYALLVAIAFVSRRKGLDPARICAIIAGLFVLNGFWRSVVLDLSYHQVYWRTDVRAASILLSVAIWLTYRHKDWPPYAPIAFAVAAVALNVNPVPNYVKYSIGTVFLALTLTSLRSRPAIMTKILEHPLSIRMGVWSFSIYLWQQPFGKVAKFQEGPLLPLLLGAFACALVSFYCIEQPARKFLNSRWSDKRKAEPAHAPVMPSVIVERLPD